jgi:hypothetical protein
MTDDEIRAGLRELGHEPPERGRLSAKWKGIYDAGTPAAGPDWDTAGDGADDLAAADDLEPSVPMQAEQPPRTARSGRRERRARPAGERLFGKRKTPAGKPKRKPPRVPVDHLVGRAWEALARFAQPLSMPVSRCLQVQSPVAGMILEEIVAGTMADRLMQPVARAEEKAEKVLALVAPPILVLALEQTQYLEPAQAQMRQALIVPMLRESLRIWLQVAGPKVEEAARREAEYQETFGHTIDELIAMFMGTVVPGEVVEEPEPEMAGAGA